MDQKTPLVIALALIVFAAIVGVRWTFGESYQITLTDLLVLVAPILIWLVVTNKLSELTLGKEGLTLKAAANQSVRGQLTRISVQEIATADKGTKAQIPELISRKVQALSLHINLENYYEWDALKEYLERLTEYTFFQYVVINNTQDLFVGAIHGRDLRASLGSPTDIGQFSYQWFTQILNNQGNVDDLSKLPGFRSKQLAISETTSNGEALSKMDHIHVSWLSVVKNDRFLGIVDRSHVLSGIILDVSKELGATA